MIDIIYLRFAVSHAASRALRLVSSFRCVSVSYLQKEVYVMGVLPACCRNCRNVPITPVMSGAAAPARCVTAAAPRVMRTTALQLSSRSGVARKLAALVKRCSGPGVRLAKPVASAGNASASSNGDSDAERMSRRLEKLLGGDDSSSSLPSSLGPASHQPLEISDRIKEKIEGETEIRYP